MRWEGSQAWRVCKACFKGDIEQMRSHAERYLAHGPTSVPPLGLPFREIVLTQNREVWWARAHRQIEEEIKARQGPVAPSSSADLPSERASIATPEPGFTGPTNSSYIESVLERLFVANLQKDGILRRRQPIKVFHPEVDDDGCDIILECNGITRHVQLKGRTDNGAARGWKVHNQLARRAAGCVILILHDRDLNLKYRYFGGAPGESLPDLGAFKTARHSKGNANGEKALRRNLKEIPLAGFRTMDSVAALSDTLFGPPQG